MSEKNCDFYRITNSDFAVSFGVFSAFGAVGAECNLIDFKSKEKIACREISPSAGADFRFLENDGSASYKTKNALFIITVTENQKRLYCKYEKSFGHTDLEADIRFSCDETSGDIQPLYKAVGFVKTRGRIYELSGDSSCGFKESGFNCKKDILQIRSQTIIGNKKFSLTALSGKNAAIAYGDNKNIADFLTITMPKDGINGTWNISSADGGIEAEFKPFFNDRIDVRHLIFNEHSDNLYGKLKGTVKLNDGTELSIENIAFIKSENN